MGYIKYQLKEVHGEEDVDTEMEHWKAKAATGRKRCPCCRVMIEKNQGCRHMTCKKCTHEFYWCCGANYRGTGAGCICQSKGDKEAKPVLEGKLFNHIFSMYTVDPVGKGIEVS